MQVFLDLLLLVTPTASVAWFAAVLLPTSEIASNSDYFQITPLHEIVWQMILYTS